MDTSLAGNGLVGMRAVTVPGGTVGGNVSDHSGPQNVIALKARVCAVKAISVGTRSMLEAP